jgi:Ser/Thr protein kinase RdoA (MazF antagonist)
MTAHNTHPNHPFQALTPDVVLDALASVGMYGDGRMTALSSYENRVYQVHLEHGLERDTAAPHSVVVKFYRPERWTEAQIREEHSFSFELMSAEIPVVGPLFLNAVKESESQFPDEPPLGKLAPMGGSAAREAASVGAKSLHHHAGFAFSVSPQRGGRTPELDDFEVLEWIGRFLARIHIVGAAKPFVHRPQLNVQSFGVESMQWLLTHNMVPLDVQAQWREKCQEAINMIATNDYFIPTTGKKYHDIATIRLHGDCHPGNILWTPTEAPTADRTLLIWTMPEVAQRYKICGCY